MSFPILENLITRARAAAASENPTTALRELLKDTQTDQAAMAEAIAAQSEDEVLLFEDDTCSIWTCRYSPDVVMPPHEHCMTVHIAVYKGREVEVLYHRESDQLRHAKNRIVETGEVLSLGPDAVHAVTADGDGQSHAIHIYQGPLTQVTRSLFDWTSGGKVAFTMENFHAMLRKRADLTDTF